MALSLLLTLTLCLSLSPLPALATDAAVITFTDAALEAKVRACLGIKGAPITVAYAQRVNNLQLNNDEKEGLGEDKLIHDISDLRYFTGLGGLSFFNNAVSDISVLAELPYLQYLDIGGNNITDLRPLSGLPLVELNIWGNGLSDLSPLAAIKTLESIMANDNQITDCSPLAGLPKLKRLILRMNPPMDFSPLASLAQQLDEKDFEILTTPYDPAEVIAFADPVLERKVRAFLNLPDGPITAGYAAYVTALDISNPWGGDVPDEDRIEDISPLKYFVNLKELYLTRNRIRDLTALSGLTQLQFLQMGDNHFDNLTPLAGLTKLECLTFDSFGCDLSPLSSLVNLKEFAIGHGNKSLPDWLPTLTQLKAFDAQGSELTDVSVLAKCTSLTSLSLGWNAISDLSPLAGLPLTRLYLSFNQITDVSALAQMPLTTLYIDQNPIVDFSPLRDIYPKLQEKDFTMLDASGIPEEALVIPDANLEVALRAALNIYDRPITTRDAYVVQRLEVIHEKREGANFSDISPLKAFVNLQYLRFNASDIADITPLAGLTKLKELDLGFQKITDISPLAGLTQLEKLTLVFNQITDVSALRGMTQLNALDIRENQIKDVSPLAGMTKLSWFLAGGNPIQDYTVLDPLLPGIKDTDMIMVPDDIPNAPLPGLDQNLAPILAKAMRIEDREITQRDAYRIDTLWLGAEDGKSPETLDISAMAYFKNMKRVDFVSLPVTDLTVFTGMPKLEWLVVAKAGLSDISPIAQMPQLKGLELYDNQITDITALAKLSNLDYLDISMNNITDMSPLLGLTKLNTLRISQNPAGDVSALAELAKTIDDKDFDPAMPLPERNVQQPQGNDQQGNDGQPQPDASTVIVFKDRKFEAAVRALLSIQGRDITIGDTQGVATLDFTTVKEGKQKFTDISPLANFTSLGELRLIGNGIKDISCLASLTNMRTLQLENQKIQDIASLSGMQNVYYLSLKENKISDLTPLTGLSELTCVDMTGNKIKDLAPLAACPKLEQLYVSKNSIEDVSPMAGVPGLMKLHVAQNKIKDVSPLGSLTHLQSLILGKNKIKDYSALAAIYANLTEKDFEIK